MSLSLQLCRLCSNALLSNGGRCSVKTLFQRNPPLISAALKQFGSFRSANTIHGGLKPVVFIPVRGMARSPILEHKKRTIIYYTSAIIITMLGLGYAAVPLYKIFCQVQGLGGQATTGHDISKVATMEPVKEKEIKVIFNADTASAMQWNFKPQQRQVKLLPGETALAFYTAKNPTDKPIIGISTYNVLPYDAAQYFNKIQCFCFEEQRLNPHEQVDMPVFFYIDPEFVEDPALKGVDTIYLSYTFFEAKDGLQLPLPGYTQPYSASKVVA